MWQSHKVCILFGAPGYMWFDIKYIVSLFFKKQNKINYKYQRKLCFDLYSDHVCLFDHLTFDFRTIGANMWAFKFKCLPFVNKHLKINKKRKRKICRVSAISLQFI